MEVSGQLPSPGHFTPGKKNQYLMDRGLGEPQSQSGRFGKERENFTSVLICHYLIIMCLKSIKSYRNMALIDILLEILKI
jgi:hypothetical protein